MADILGFPHVFKSDYRVDYEVDPNEVTPPPSHSTSAQVLLEAAELLEGERAVQHGCKHELHSTMCDLMYAYLSNVKGPLRPHHAAMLECIMKIARSLHGQYNRDDYRDGGAYFGISCELREADEKVC